MNLGQKIQRRWNQFRIETESGLASFLGLVVNLHFSNCQPTREIQIIVLLDSWREALFLALLQILAVLPRHKVYVIARSEDIRLIVHRDVGKTLFFITASLYSKRYNSLLEADLKASLLII